MSMMRPLTCAALALSLTGQALAENEKVMAGDSIGKWLDENLKHRFVVLGMATQTQPNYDSSININNDLLGIEKSALEAQIKADFELKREIFSLTMKPRYRHQTLWLEEGFNGSSSKRQDRLFINEWSLDIKPDPSVVIGYGREVRQWGPSLFMNLSNPFLLDNGRNNPYQELGGTDFLRIAHLPSYNLSYSLIANVSRGEAEARPDGFKQTYALQTEYSGVDFSLGGILSKRVENNPRLGLYGQWTANEAVILYGELSTGSGRTGCYIHDDASSPIELTFECGQQKSSKLYTNWLTGASYTLLGGGTINLEYAHYAEGYSSDEFNQLTLLNQSLQGYILGGNANADLASYLVARSTSPGLQHLRQNYLFFSYIHNNIINQVDINLRYALGIDDGSSQIIGILDWYVRDDMKLFVLGSKSLGPKNGEFKYFIKSQLYVGFEAYH
ncbi:MAG: hypothetical protein AB1479_07480 [Pseudomonadota bacterium]